MKKATLQDVAQEAGVAKSTAADILRDGTKWSYKPTTIATVQAAAKRLNYRPHFAAQALRRRQTNLIGIMIDVRASHLSALVRQLHDELLRHKYKPLLMDASTLEATPELFFSHAEMMSGILSADVLLEETISTHYAKISEQLPIIALYPVRDPHLECVTTDRAQAMEIAVEHLVALGHRHIVLAQAGGKTATSAMKRQGWQRALRAHHLPHGATYEIVTSCYDSGPESGQNAARLFMNMTPRPTALICASDTMALAAMSTLQDAGWKIPTEVSVMGFGGEDIGAIFRPALTTVCSPNVAVAQAAVARLITLVEEHDRENIPLPRHQLIAASLLQRASSGPTPI